MKTKEHNYYDPRLQERTSLQERYIGGHSRLNSNGLAQLKSEVIYDVYGSDNKEQIRIIGNTTFKVCLPTKKDKENKI